ncbi:MAG: hypothetical protein ACOYIQ_06365 [Christensenellales bacterium]|jgi:hypothetical protein
MTFKESECFLGRCLNICTAKAELAVTLDVGPRIISFAKKGEDNIFFNDIHDERKRDVSAVFGKGARWHIYGGHRIWVAPEGEETYVPDNDKVDYEVKGNTAVFTAPPWKKRNIRVSLEIEGTEDNYFRIAMRAKNVGQHPRTFALWGLTVCRAGGSLDIPLSQANKGYLPNRNIVLWSYSDFFDPRFTLANDKLTVRGSALGVKPFKVGVFNPDVYCVFRLENTTFIKEAKMPEGVYPDMGCNIECYTCNPIQEVETLSPLTEVMPGQEITLSEYWRIL